MAPAVRAGRETVLVVEDNPTVRRTAVRQLATLGYQVVEADGPVAALAVLKNGGPIDIMFTDVVMPGGTSGLDLSREAAGLRPGLKVLYTSGFLGSAMRDAMRLG